MASPKLVKCQTVSILVVAHQAYLELTVLSWKPAQQYQPTGVINRLTVSRIAVSTNQMCASGGQIGFFQKAQRQLPTIEAHKLKGHATDVLGESGRGRSRPAAESLISARAQCLFCRQHIVQSGEGKNQSQCQ